MGNLGNTCALAALWVTACLCPAGHGWAAQASGKAHLSIDLTYDEEFAGNYNESAPTKLSEIAHATASFSETVVIETHEDGSFAINEIPSDQLSQNDRPQGSAQATYAAKYNSANSEITTEGSKTSSGTGKDNEVLGGMESRSASISLNFSGTARCREEIHDLIRGENQTSDKCEGGEAGGYIDLPTTDGQGGSAAHFSFAVHALTGEPKEAADPPDYYSSDWYGATAEGNAQNGYTITLDGARSITPKSGVVGKKHVRMVAKLMPLGLECKLDYAMLKRAYDKALDAKQIARPPEYLTADQRDDHFLTYAARLTGDNGMLPTQGWVQEAVAHGASAQPGAQHLLLGAVQVSGQTYRVTARIVETESAVVQIASRGDGKGCDNGLEQAVVKAVAGLPLRSYQPRQ